MPTAVQPAGLVGSVLHSIATSYKPRSGGLYAPFSRDGGESDSTANPIAAPPPRAGQKPAAAAAVVRLREARVSGVFGVAWFSPDGRVFAGGGADKNLTLYDVVLDQVIAEVPLDGALRASAPDPSTAGGGAYLFALSGDARA